jgi:hypothetical protein
VFNLQTHSKWSCAHFCGLCQRQNGDTECAFEEAYRSLWVESSAKAEDQQILIGPYSMSIDGLGRMDCVKLEDKPEGVWDRHKVSTVKPVKYGHLA